jgi:TorA maturation chaperone TorD
MLTETPVQGILFVMRMEEKVGALETARSLVYKELANTYRPPGPDLPHVIDRLESALARLKSHAYDHAALLKSRQTAPEAVPCSLEIDFTGLFMGPFMALAPPNGSVSLEDKRQLMGNSTIDVRRHYLSVGLDLSSDFMEAPDHICAELEFMHVLISREIAALEAGDYDPLWQSIEHQRIFLKTHLGAWIPGFTTRVMENARTDYYRYLADVTQTFVAEDMESLPDLPQDRAIVIPVQDLWIDRG